MVMELERQYEEDEDYIQDGQKRIVHTVKTPVRDEKGGIFGVLVVFWDVTDQKQMQEQLILTDRLASIGQLASGIAHELNNPLTSVIGFSELLLERDLPDDIKEDLEIVNREAKRTANVVKGLLTFVRKQGTEKELVDINSIIQGVLQLRSYEQRISNIEVNDQFYPDLPEIMGNGAHLQQVFMNLIVNAEQAMLEAHGRGTLTITTERVGDIVRASITDDGPGISPDNMRRIFTPFFTTKEVGKGTGLGLSICHGILTEHGGKIYTESEPGKGATFIVELPISQ
jgi:signal transduction histidine kinase